MAKPFEKILSNLTTAGVDFVLVGGFAVVAHGFRRVTDDLDLIVRFDRENVEKLNSCLQDNGFAPRMPIDPSGLASGVVRAEWQSRNMIALSFIEGKTPFNVIDVFIDHPIDYDKLVSDSVGLNYSAVEVRICSVSHLIHMKEVAGRAKDLLDLRFLYDILQQEKEGLR